MQVIDNEYNISLDDSNLSNRKIKWTWACRILERKSYNVQTVELKKLEPGDLVLVKIDQVGKHNAIITSNNKRLRIYQNDLVVGIFGNRYATAAYEGKVIEVMIYQY